MSTLRFCLLLVIVAGLAVAGAQPAANSEATTGVAPEFQYIGKLAFGPEGVLFAADAQEVSITALHLGEEMAGGAPGRGTCPRSIGRSPRCSASTPATC